MQHHTIDHQTLAPGAAVAPDPLRDRSRRVWRAGTYDRIAAGFRHEAEAFVARLELAESDAVLDAACGTGNLALPAARAGARVRGLDLVPELLAVAREQARIEGLDIAFDEGSVESLPYPDASFDVVTSMFGVSFAARPLKVAEELRRVVRPGGLLALANWTPEGFTGRMLALHAAAVPPPPGVASPLMWGDEATVRALLGEDGWRFESRVRRLSFRFPHTPRGIAELFRGAYGPTVMAMAALDEDGRADLHGKLTEHWVGGARGVGRDGITEVEAEYLELWATRR
jgi:SAM-dependent methyltransferase